MACTFSTSEPPKVVRTPGAFNILTSKCASRHLRRALFRHLNCQKWSAPWCVLHILISKCCFAPATAVHFFDMLNPKVVRPWCWSLYILTSKCASRQNGVHFLRHLNFQKWYAPGVFCTFWRWKCASRHQRRCNFFISHLASWLRTRRFSEPTFRPSGAPNHWKNTVCRTLSYHFTHPHLLSSYSFSSTLLSSNLSLLSVLFPALLFICPYCRKFDF